MGDKIGMGRGLMIRQRSTTYTPPTASRLTGRDERSASDLHTVQYSYRTCHIELAHAEVVLIMI